MSLTPTFISGSPDEGVALESDEVARISRRNTPVEGPVSVSVTDIPVVSAWEVTDTLEPVSFFAAPQ